LFHWLGNTSKDMKRKPTIKSTTRKGMLLSIWVKSRSITPIKLNVMVIQFHNNWSYSNITKCYKQTCCWFEYFFFVKSEKMQLAAIVTISEPAQNQNNISQCFETEVQKPTDMSRNTNSPFRWFWILTVRVYPMFFMGTEYSKTLGCRGSRGR
jgi:hypothetical protein